MDPVRFPTSPLTRAPARVPHGKPGGSLYGTDLVLNVTTTASPEDFQIVCNNVGTFNAEIDWGDESSSTITAFNDADLTHSFATAGSYTIRISGTFPSIGYDGNAHGDKIDSIPQFGNVGLINLTNAFNGCANLVSAGNSAFDVVVLAASSIGETFRACPLLESVDINGWDVSAVTDMGSMFDDCFALDTIDLSSWDVGSVTTFDNMFNDCNAITSLDFVENWDVSSATNMASMFEDCRLVTSLDLSNWSFGVGGISMDSTFRSCTALTSLNLTGWTPKPTTLKWAFEGCAFSTVDVSGFDTSSCTSLYRTFRLITELTSVAVDNWDIEAVTTYDNMFQSSTLDTSNYDAILIAWAAQDAVNSQTIHFGSSKYTSGGAAEAARTSLVDDDLWVITDGGAAA